MCVYQSLQKLKEDDVHVHYGGPGVWGAGGSALEGGEHLQEEISQAETCGELFSSPKFSSPSSDQVEDFLTEQDVEESWKFEDFGGRQLLADHVENIRVEWSASCPSRVFATATKRFLFYKHLGMGIYNDMEEEDEEGDEEDESPGFNMMVLPNTELCGLWSVALLFLFIFESLLDDIRHQGVPDLRGGPEGEPFEEH